MRISDWSSDVCSSDLARWRRRSAIVLLNGEPTAGGTDRAWQTKTPVSDRSLENPRILNGANEPPNAVGERQPLPRHGTLAVRWRFALLTGNQTRSWSQTEAIFRPRSEEHTSELPSIMR